MEKFRLEFVFEMGKAFDNSFLEASQGNGISNFGLSIFGFDFLGGGAVLEFWGNWGGIIKFLQDNLKGSARTLLLLLSGS